jgi:glycosidase
MVVDANSSTALEVFLDPSSKADAGIDQGLAYAANFDILARTSPMSDLDSYLSSNSGAYNGIPCLALFTGSTRPINYAEDVPDTSGDGWSSSASPTQSAFERMETAFAIVFTLPGMPYIEYGDEIGMTGHGEPLSYQMMHFALSANEAALHDRVALLASIRAAHSALRNGSYSSLGSAADTLAFKVSNSSESVIVLVNRSDAIASLGGIPSGSYTDAITGTPVSVFPVSVLPRSAMILVSQ